MIIKGTTKAAIDARVIEVSLRTCACMPAQEHVRVPHLLKDGTPQADGSQLRQHISRDTPIVAARATLRQNLAVVRARSCGAI
jgi:hypothetical protein